MPLAGEAYFGPGTASQAELRQDVDVTGFAAYVDAGIQRFAFEGFVYSPAGASPDAARVVIEYRDASGAEVLADFDSGEIAGTGAWQQVAELTTVPPGTRFVRVRLISRRVSGSENNAYYDSLSLRALGTPVISIDDPVAGEGDPGGAAVSLDFTLSLSCPADETVTVDYATADLEATGGVDYADTAGTVTFAAGATDETISVAVIGDLETEPREQLELALASATAAVIFDRRGIGTIIDDESEPVIDLRLAKAAERPAVRPGEELDFTLQVTNRGREAATGIVLRDVLPPHLELVAASHGGLAAGGTVTWNLASLAPGTTASRTLTVRGANLLPFGETVVNTATVADDGTLGADQNPGDNAAEEPLLLSEEGTPVVVPQRSINLSSTGAATRACASSASRSRLQPGRYGAH